ncbi:MAG: hypothetical protein V4481_05490 [Patescibacteria group bacterium]
MNNHTKNITNTRWMPQDNFCGYILVSVFSDALASSRDVSYMLLS